VRISPVNEVIEPRNCFDDFHHAAMVDLLNVEVLMKVLTKSLFVPATYTSVSYLDTGFRPHRRFKQVFFDELHSTLMYLQPLKRLEVSRKHSKYFELYILSTRNFRRSNELKQKKKQDG
jgi:hypothetical protein